LQTLLLELLYRVLQQYSFNGIESMIFCVTLNTDCYWNCS